MRMFQNGYKRLTNKVKPTYDFDHDKYSWKPDIDYRENPHHIR